MTVTPTPPLSPLHHLHRSSSSSVSSSGSEEDWERDGCGDDLSIHLPSITAATVVENPLTSPARAQEVSSDAFARLSLDRTSEISSLSYPLSRPDHGAISLCSSDRDLASRSLLLRVPPGADGARAAGATAQNLSQQYGAGIFWDASRKSCAAVFVSEVICMRALAGFRRGSCAAGPTMVCPGGDGWDGAEDSPTDSGRPPPSFLDLGGTLVPLSSLSVRSNTDMEEALRLARNVAGADIRRIRGTGDVGAAQRIIGGALGIRASEMRRAQMSPAPKTGGREGPAVWRRGGGGRGREDRRIVR